MVPTAYIITSLGNSLLISCQVFFIATQTVSLLILKKAPETISNKTFMMTIDGMKMRDLSEKFIISLRNNFEDSLRNNFEDSLRDTLGNRLRDSLKNSLKNNLVSSLGDSLRETAQNEQSEQPPRR